MVYHAPLRLIEICINYRLLQLHKKPKVLFYLRSWKPSVWSLHGWVITRTILLMFRRIGTYFRCQSLPAKKFSGLRGGQITPPEMATKPLGLLFGHPSDFGDLAKGCLVYKLK